MRNKTRKRAATVAKPSGNTTEEHSTVHASASRSTFIYASSEGLIWMTRGNRLLPISNQHPGAHTAAINPPVSELETHHGGLATVRACAGVETCAKWSLESRSAGSNVRNNISSTPIRDTRHPGNKK